MAEDGCTLLSLPPEIRNMIYEYVLAVKSDEFGFVKMRRIPKSARAFSVLALLQTCKQLNGEAGGIFYSLNVISLHNLQVKTFVNAMGPSRLLQLTRIGVCVFDRGSCLGNLKFLDHLKHVPRLEMLTMEIMPHVQYAYISTLDPTNDGLLRRKIRGMASLRKIRVKSAGEKDNDRRYEWSQENSMWIRSNPSTM